jgi:ATP phosphoribosyltransferase
MTSYVLGIPSKGRLMDATMETFARAGMAIERTGTERGYRGKLTGVAGVEVAFLAASEIAQQLVDGKISAGITGEDLLQEAVPPEKSRLHIAARLPFGYADVVVAVPMCWLDVAAMSDLNDVSEQLYQAQGKRVRVATKYTNLTRRFFARHGVRGYRIVPSLGATEGAPAAGFADVIVDITTSGATLLANHLKILDDGVMLKSSAVLAVQETVAEATPFIHVQNRLHTQPAR